MLNEKFHLTKINFLSVHMMSHTPICYSNLPIQIPKGVMSSCILFHSKGAVIISQEPPGGLFMYIFEEGGLIFRYLAWPLFKPNLKTL